MNQRYASSAYFAKESDARRAADDLRARGYDADVHSEGSHGQSFWDSIRNFFRGEQGQSEYSAGALLMVSAADPQIVRTVVQQYNGRISDVAAPTIASETPAASEPPISRTTPVGTADIGTTTMPPPATGVPPSATTTFGETDELERDRIRTTGGSTTGLGGGATIERGGIDDTGL